MMPLMKISDVVCSSCGASYQVAEAATVSAEPGQVNCAMCGSLLDRWDTPRLRAFRLVMSPAHQYARVPVPPAPAALR